jgi:hypothetical protein
MFYTIHIIVANLCMCFCWRIEINHSQLKRVGQKYCTLLICSNSNSRGNLCFNAIANMNFYKYHGAGNDFVIVNLLHSAGHASHDASLAPLPLSPDQCRAVCDRHFGVGADGVLFAAPGINV